MGSAATLPCLLLCILYLTAGASAKPHCMVLFPTVLYYPYMGKVHIHLMELDAPVRVTLHLATSHHVPDAVLEEQGSGILQLDWPRFSNITFHPPHSSEQGQVQVSIQGGSLQFSQQRMVELLPLELGTLIQTDKDVYKPGQTVKIRIASFDRNFIPSNEIPWVVMEDPRNREVANWYNLSPQQGIVELSFPLAAESPLGTYTITVGWKTHSFSVQDHGLPRFEVLLRLPSLVAVKDEKIPLEVCGGYPSGKTFRGRAKVKLCQPPGDTLVSENSARICAEFRGQTGRNGCFSVEVPVASLNLTHFHKELHVTASLLEEGTGMSRTARKTCQLVFETVLIFFENTEEFYKPGIPCTGTMLLKGVNGSALKEKEFLLVVEVRGEKQNIKTLRTDGSGRASFELDTSDWTDQVSLHGELKDEPPASQHEVPEPLSYQSIVHYLDPFSLDTPSFLRIQRVEKELPCGQPQQLRVDYFFDEATEIELQSLDVVFLVLAKGTIVTVLRKELPAEAGPRGSFSLELPISLELAPRAKVLGYVMLPDGGMVADSTELKVDRCIPSKVNLSLSEQRAPVGSQLRLKLQAAPGSLCAIYAVDKRTQPFGSTGMFDPSTVYDFLPVFNEEGYPIKVEEHDPPLTPLCQIKKYREPMFSVPSPSCFDTPGSESWKLCQRMRGLREAPEPPVQPGSFAMFKDAGLKFASNARLGCTPEVRLQDYKRILNPIGISLHMIELAGVMQDTGMQLDSLQKWLWQLVPVGEGSSAEVTATVPDVITEWEIRMFCTSLLGLAMAPATSLTAFKPFFVELALPYTVIRHEAFTLVATVFNYLRQCLRVQVTLVESAELEVLAGSNRAYRDCFCADEERTFQWSVRATSLGKVSVTVVTIAKAENLCSTEVPMMAAQGHRGTKTKLLTVQPPNQK